MRPLVPARPAPANPGDEQSIAPTIDLVLLSHGDLAHAGLFPYAFCRWGLRAPCYSTIPVQATARIAVTEDVEGLRDEQEMDDSDMGGDTDDPSTPEAGTNQAANTGDETMVEEGAKSPPKERKRKFVATIHEVNEAFDSVNTLRYSQPTHLQGTSPLLSTALTAQRSHRQVSGPHHHPFQCWPHSRWRHLESPLPIRRNHRLCRQPESHERTASRWDDSPPPRRRFRSFRAPPQTRSADHGRREGFLHQ